MTLIKRQRVLAAAIESTSGTAETLDATDATINCFDVEIQAGIEFNERMGQSAFSRLPGVPGGRMGTVTFKTEITGDGAGGIPTWASTFLPACGWTASAQVYSPKTEPPGSNVKTLTIGVYERGSGNALLKQIKGAAGTFKFIGPSGKPTSIEWTFTGVWVAPSDATMLTPTYDNNIPIRFADITLTVGGSAIGCINQMEIDAGNNVIMRECPTETDGSGYAAALITDRRVVGTFDPESRLVATEDVFGAWIAGTEAALSCVLADANDTITLAAPKIQRTNIQEGDRNGIQVDNQEFQCNRSAAAGDDEFTITFAAT